MRILCFIIFLGFVFSTNVFSLTQQPSIEYLKECLINRGLDKSALDSLPWLTDFLEEFKSYEFDFFLGMYKHAMKRDLNISDLEYFKKQKDLFEQQLKNEESDFVLFSIGGGGYELQEIPIFIKDIAKQFPKKNIKIYSINPGREHSSLADFQTLIDKDNQNFNNVKNSDFEQYKHVNLNITLDFFRFPIPYVYKEIEGNFLYILKNAILNLLKAGKIVFIGYHIRAPNITEGGIGDVYKIIFNSGLAKNLQLYIQAGEYPVIIVFNPPPQYFFYGESESESKVTPTWLDKQGRYFGFYPGAPSNFATFDISSFLPDKVKMIISGTIPPIHNFGFKIKENDNRSLQIVGIIGYPTEPIYALGRRMNELKDPPKLITGSYDIENTVTLILLKYNLSKLKKLLVELKNKLENLEKKLITLQINLKKA